MVGALLPCHQFPRDGLIRKLEHSYGVDIDAVSGWLGSYGGEDSTSDISRGMSSSVALCGQSR